MMVHICTRSDCPPVNVQGPKTKCAKFNNVCYLKCFGIEKSENLNENFETVSIQLGESTVMYALLPCTVFVCCESLSPEELKVKLKMPSNRGNSKTRQAKSTDSKSNTDNSAVLSELNEIKGMISKLQSKTEDIHEDTQFIAKKSIDRNVTGQKKTVSSNISLTNTPKTSFMHGPPSSYANALRDDAPVKSAKRPRTEEISKSFPPSMKSSKIDAPKPRMGTKSTTTRLNVVHKPTREEKPIFKKAIWISGFDPMTTEQEIMDYIVEDTPVKNKEKFRVHKLVKKGQDVSTLKFVSFKIEVNEDVFNVLIEPEAWESDVFVREFVQNTTMGDFLFPALNAKNGHTSTTSDQMDIVDLNTQSNTQTKQMKSPSKKSPEASNKTLSKA